MRMGVSGGFLLFIAGITRAKGEMLVPRDNKLAYLKEVNTPILLALGGPGPQNER
jgi:hypothetical protein